MTQDDFTFTSRGEKNKRSNTSTYLEAKTIPHKPNKLKQLLQVMRPSLPNFAPCLGGRRTCVPVSAGGTSPVHNHTHMGLYVNSPGWMASGCNRATFPSTASASRENPWQGNPAAASGSPSPRPPPRVPDSLAPCPYKGGQDPTGTDLDYIGELVPSSIFLKLFWPSPPSHSDSVIPRKPPPLFLAPHRRPAKL